MRPSEIRQPVDHLVAIESRRGRSWHRLVAQSGDAWVVDRAALAALGFVPSDTGALPVGLGAHQRALLDEAERATARRRVLVLLAQRARSRAELLRLMQLWPFRRESVEDAVNWAAELGYVNDRELAAQMAARLRGSPVGRPALLARMQQRGIDPGTAHQALAEEYPPEAEREQAHRAARRRLATLRDLEPPDQARRLASWLLGRGFELETVRQVVADLLGPGACRVLGEESS